MASKSNKYQVFQSNLDSLLPQVAQNITTVALNAFSKGLIANEAWSDAQNPNQNERYRASRLLQNILERIEEQESHFDTFVEILSKDHFHQDLVEKLQEDLQSKLQEASLMPNGEIPKSLSPETKSTSSSLPSVSDLVIEEQLLKTVSTNAVDDTSSEQSSNPVGINGYSGEPSSSVGDATDHDDSSLSATQQQIRPFKCPCGNNCSFDDYIRGKCVPIKDLFPYLDTSSLSPTEKENVERQLLYAAEDMYRAFQTFVRETFKSFKDKKPSIDPYEFQGEILTILQSYLRKLNNKDATGDRSIDQFTDIIKTKSFLLSHQLISFFNFQKLEDLITLFGTSDDTERLEEYKKKFRKFCLRSVFEVPSHIIENLSPSPSEGTFELVMKINEGSWFGGKYDTNPEEFTMDEVYNVERTLANVLELSGGPNYILFRGVRKGCVELTFLILSEAVTFKLTPFQIEELLMLGIRVTFQAMPALSLQKPASFFLVNTREDVIIIIEVKNKKGSDVLHYLYLSGQFSDCEEAILNLEDTVNAIGITNFSGIVISNYDGSCCSSQLATLLSSLKFTSDLLMLPSPYCSDPQFASLLSQYNCTRDIFPDPTTQYEFRLKECPSCLNFAFQGAGPHVVIATDRKAATVISTSETRSLLKSVSCPSADKNLNTLRLASEHFQNRPACNILIRIDDYDQNECALLGGNVPTNILLEHVPPGSSVSFLQVSGSVNSAGKAQPPFQQLVSQAHSFVSEGISKLYSDPSRLLRYLEIHGVSDMHTVIETESNAGFQQLIRHSYESKRASWHHVEELSTNKQFGMILKKASLSCCKSLQSLAMASEFVQCLEKVQDSNVTVFVSGRPNSTVVSALLKFFDKNKDSRLILMNIEGVDIPTLREISTLDTVRKDSSSSEESVVASPKLKSTLRSVSLGGHQKKSNTLPKQRPSPSKFPKRTERLFSESAVQQSPKLLHEEKKPTFRLPSTKLFSPNKQAIVETKTSLVATSNQPFLGFDKSEDVSLKKCILHEARLGKLLTQREQTLSSFVTQPDVWNKLPTTVTKSSDYHKGECKGVPLGKYLEHIFKSNDPDSKPVKKTATLKNALKYLLGPSSESQLDSDNLKNLIPRGHTDKESLALKTVLDTLLKWKVVDGDFKRLDSKTKFHLTPTDSSAYAASIVVTKFSSTDLIYHDACVLGALIKVTNAKSNDLKVELVKLDTSPPKPDLNLLLNFKLDGMCGTTLTDYVYSLYERGTKEADIIKSKQMYVNEVLALVLNPQRALKIMFSFPIIIQQCIGQVPFSHALSIVNMQYLEKSRQVPEARWELIDAFIKTKKWGEIPCTLSVSTSSDHIHVVELRCTKSFSLQIRRGYKVIDRGVEITNKYTYKEVHSGKLLCTSHFTRDSLPEMTLISSLELSTFTSILRAFDLPDPNICDVDSQILKLPLLDKPLRDVKFLHSPALTLTQVSPHLHQMVVSKVSFTAGKKRSSPHDHVVGAILRQTIEQNYLPDVFVNYQEHSKPTVSILNPYGKVPEIQLAVYVTAEVNVQEASRRAISMFNISLTATNTLEASLPPPETYTLTVTNSGENDETRQRSTLLYVLRQIGCPLDRSVPSCVQEILSKMDIQRLKLAFSTSTKTLQRYEMHCSLKQVDLVNDLLSAKEVSVHISYSHSEGVQIQCKGLLSLLSPDWLPQIFSLPTIDKPGIFEIDCFMHQLSLSSLLESSLWCSTTNQDSESDSEETLLKTLTPDTRDILKDLGMNHTLVHSLQLEVQQYTADNSQRSLLIVSNALIKLNVIECLKLGELIRLEDTNVTVEVVSLRELSNRFQVNITLSGSLSKCLHLELLYNSQSCCFNGSLSVNTTEAKRGTALCVVENLKAENSTQLLPVYECFKTWTRQITILVTKFLGIQETKRFYNSLSFSHAVLSIKYLQDQRVNFILEYLRIYLIDLLRDHHNAFEITDLHFEYITSEDLNFNPTEDDQLLDEEKACAVLAGVLFVGNKRLKVVFDLGTPSSSPASETKELTCTIQPMTETESLSLSTLIEIARCNQPQLPDIEIPTNIYNLDVKKGFVVFGFSPFRIKRFDVFLSATPIWIVNEAPSVQFENVVFRILFDSEKPPETACQVSFECVLILCDASVPILGFISKESIKASAVVPQESEVVTIDFQNVLIQWPPTGEEDCYTLPTDIALPPALFSSSRLSLDILLEKDFKQVKFEASTSNKWMIDLAKKSSDAKTSSSQSLENDSELSVTILTEFNTAMNFCSLGYFLNFQVSTTFDRYLALVFGKFRLSDVSLEGHMLLGTDSLIATAFLCKDDLGQKLSLTNVASQYTTENIFVDPEITTKLIADQLVPSIALLHVDVRTKHLLICGKLNDSSSTILYLKYSQEKKKFLCTVLLTLDQNFKFKQVSESLGYVDNVMSVSFARLMITNEDRPLTNVLNEVSTTVKGTCDDYKLYESHAADSRIPLPTKVTKDHKTCTHVRSLSTDRLIKDISRSFNLWPFPQRQSSYADPLQPGLCLYASFDVKSAEHTSPPIKTALKILVKPDLRDTQLVVLAKCANVSDNSSASVKFLSYLDDIELFGSLLAEDVAVTFEVTESRSLHNLLLGCTLHVLPKDETLSFQPLSFKGRLEIENEEATFTSREHSASTLPVSKFEIDPCKMGSQEVTSLSIVVKYDSQFWPLVTISGFATSFLGFLEAQAELLLIGSTFRLFRINIPSEADFYAFLKAQNLCDKLLINPDMITIHSGELYFSRCDSFKGKLPDVDGSLKSYRANGLWLDCDASLLNEHFIIEVCFPVSGNNFSIKGGKKEKIKLFGFITLTNDMFRSGPQLELTQNDSGSSSVSLNVGVELWGIPWFKGTLTFKPNGGTYVKSPGFEASIKCVKKIFKDEELKVAVAWSLMSGFEIHEMPLDGTLDTLMSLSGFLNQWQIVARLAYALINMSRVRVSIKGNLRMETSEEVPEDCCCVFVWDGSLNITGKNNIKIEIELPKIPIAIRRYDPTRHPNLISFLFDCLWASTDKIAKSVLNYLCSSKRFHKVMRGVYDTLNQTVKNVRMFIPKQFHSFGIGKGNSFWVLNEKGLPVAYCEHHNSESPYAKLFGRPLAMKAIQEVATVMLSNARATNELAHENGPSLMTSSLDLDAFEKYIYQIECKAEKWSQEALKIDCIVIDVREKYIKWKMSKNEKELDVRDLVFHVRVIGTLVLTSSPSFELQDNVLIFETPPSGIEMKSSKDSLTYTEDGWLVLDLASVSSQDWEKASSIATSVYASVINNVTVLPPSISEETTNQTKESLQSLKDKTKEREQIESDFKKEGWKNVVHIRGSCCYTECMAQQIPPQLPPISFSDNIQYISNDHQIVGSICTEGQLPPSSYCVVQLFNTENSTDIIWQKLLQDNNFMINVKELPTGTSSGPYKLRTIVIASDCSFLSEFVISKFEISRCDSPKCIRQKTENSPETHALQQDNRVQFFWKEPGYFQQSTENNSESTEHCKVVNIYQFSGRIKESDLVLFDGSTQECEFKCKLKALFEKHDVPLSESVNLLFKVATLGDTEKLDSVPSTIEFIVLAPPTNMELSPPSDEFGIHIEWKFAANAMSYLIKLVNTSTGVSKTIRNHIPEQRLGKKYLKGSNGDEKYKFDSEAFKSNTEDDIFVVHTESEESSTETEPEEHTDTLALLSFIDLKQFLQLEQATYKIEMFSSGDGDKCIQSLDSCISSNEEKIEVLSSENVQLRFDYKTDQFITVVQSNEVFANGHVIELLMEYKDEDESQALSTDYLAKRVIYPNYTDSTIHTVFKKWKKRSLKPESRVVAAVSSTCPDTLNGVSCTLAKSYNTLKVLSPPSNVMFTTSCTSTSKKCDEKTLSESSSSQEPDSTISSQIVEDDKQAEIIQPSSFEVVFNTMDDVIVSHSSGHIVVNWEGEDTADGTEYVVGFISKTRYLYRRFNSTRKITSLDLDRLQFHRSTSCQLFVQLADTKGYDVTSPFAFSDHWFHCIKAEVRTNRQWKFETIRVVFTTESIFNVYTAVWFRNCAVFSTAIKTPEIKHTYPSNNNVAHAMKLGKQKSQIVKHGSSPSELTRIRFKLAKKLVRKLKCQYAFVYDMQTSNQYEYLVCQPPRSQAPKYKPSRTTFHEVSATLNAQEKSKSDKLSPKTPPTQSKVGTKAGAQNKPPVAKKPSSLTTSRSHNTSTQSHSTTGKQKKNTGGTSAQNQSRSRPGSQQSSAMGRGGPGAGTNRGQGRSPTTVKTTPGISNVGRPSSQSRRGPGASVSDPKSTKEPPKTEKSPDESKKGFIASLVSIFESKKPSEQEQSQPNKPASGRRSTRKHQQQGGVQKPQSPRFQSQKYSSQKQGSPTIRQPSTNSPVTSSTQQKLMKETKHDVQSSPLSTGTDPKQLLEESDTVRSKWVFVKPSTYEIVLKASKYNIECPLSVAQTLPDGNITTLVQTRKLWFTVIPANQPIRKTDFKKHIKTCRELNSIHFKSWASLAAKVGLPPAKVKSIALSLDSKTQKSLFITEWTSKRQYQASWDKLVLALKSLELHKVAAKIWKVYAVSPGKGYLPMFYHDLRSLSKLRDSTYTLTLEEKHFKHPTLPRTTQRFIVLIHARCVPSVNEHIITKATNQKKGPTWFKLQVTINKKTSHYLLWKKDNKIDECARSGTWSSDSYDKGSISRAFFARNVRPKESESLVITLKAIKCEVEAFEALVVPS